MTTHILTHLHKRRTGVTTHVEDLTEALNGLGRQAYALGNSLVSTVPQLTRKELTELFKNGSSVTWHCHRPHSLREGLRLRKKWPKLRVVWTHHSWKTPSWTTKRLAEKADRIVCLTTEGANQLSLPSQVIGHGVPLHGLTPRPLPPKPRLGIVGRIRPDKGHLSVVEAFADLQSEATDWELSFFGETRPQHRHFERKLRARLPQSLRIHGFEPNREAMYGSLSAVIMPSPAEGFSLVVPEALAMGLPLIAARLPHFERCLRDGENVLFFDPSSPKDLATVLRRLVHNPDLRTTLREGARRAAEEHFSIVSEAKQVARLYDEVLDEPLLL